MHAMLGHARPYPPCRRGFDGRMVGCSDDARGRQHKKRHDRRGVERIRRLRAEDGGIRDAKEGIHRASVNRRPLQHCFSSTLTIASPKSVFQPALGNETLPTTVHNDLLCLIRSAMYILSRVDPAIQYRWCRHNRLRVDHVVY
jgi:hypothetical protein